MSLEQVSMNAVRQTLRVLREQANEAVQEMAHKLDNAAYFVDEHVARAMGGCSDCMVPCGKTPLGGACGDGPCPCCVWDARA